MKIYTLPLSWDARKFAIRYNLNRDQDFYVDGEGKLVVFPVLPDDPPIFELPDPPGPTEKELLDQRLTAIESRLVLVEGKVI